MLPDPGKEIFYVFKHRLMVYTSILTQGWEKAIGSIQSICMKDKTD